MPRRVYYKTEDLTAAAGLFKRLIAGVNIVTPAEGDITHLHIGFKGTMNALFLKDLAEKTHRGLRRAITATNRCACWSAPSLARPRVNGSSVKSQRSERHNPR
jgi:hypothetical protein